MSRTTDTDTNELSMILAPALEFSEPIPKTVEKNSTFYYNPSIRFFNDLSFTLNDDYGWLSISYEDTIPGDVLFGNPSLTGETTESLGGDAESYDVCLNVTTIDGSTNYINFTIYVIHTYYTIDEDTSLNLYNIHNYFADIGLSNELTYSYTSENGQLELNNNNLVYNPDDNYNTDHIGNMVQEKLE